MVLKDLCNSTLIVFTEFFSVIHDAESERKTEPVSTVAFDELGGNLCSSILGIVCCIWGHVVEQLVEALCYKL